MELSKIFENFMIFSENMKIKKNIDIFIFFVLRKNAYLKSEKYF